MKESFKKAILLTAISVFVLTGCALGGKKVTLTVGDQSYGQLIVYLTGHKEPAVLKSGDRLEVKEGESLTIEARGDTGYDFNYWNGIDEETKQVILSLNKDLEISAVFSEKEYMVSLDSPEGGTVKFSPEIRNGRKYPANTVFTISAVPEKDYTIDSLYYATQGPLWINYIESNENETSITLTTDMRIGASFIETRAIEGFTVLNDVVYAQPGVKPLKYDLYTPDGAVNLPLIIIVHGGGWVSNSEDIMRGMAREMVKTGKYVVASIDYRWINNMDKDPVPNHLEDLIGDVYGAIGHIVEHAGEYGADPGRIAITGDSAGGHLGSSAATMIERIGDGGFGIKEGVYEIIPTYLPEKMSASAFRDHLMKSVKAVSPTYGVFDLVSTTKSRDLLLDKMSKEGRIAVSPIRNIPSKEERIIPHLLIRGTKDPLITNGEVQAYADALNLEGQTAEYIQVEGAGHAFFDWKPDSETRATFKQIGVPNIHRMLAFFDRYL